MSIKRLTAMMMAGLFVGLAVFSTGCFSSVGPTLGIFSVPIPVSPYWQKNQEDKFHIQERYARVPILGPLTQGGPATAMDPPSDDECWWAFERANSVQGGIPFLHEVQRNNVTFVKEKIADYVDPASSCALDWPSPIAPRTLQSDGLLQRTKSRWVAFPTHTDRRRLG